MQHRELCFVLPFVILVLITSITAKTTTIVKHTETTNPELEGFWTEKTSWTARWVKYWRPKAIYVPIWKKVWTPTIQKEWVPLPNKPTGWENDIND